MQILANNKKAYFDYFIEEEYEAGLELKGTEGNYYFIKKRLKNYKKNLNF